MAPAIIESAKTWQKNASFNAWSFQDNVKMIGSDLKWKGVKVKEKDEDEHERSKYFLEKKKEFRSFSTDSKIVQVNKQNLYVLGGRMHSPVLLSRDYPVMKSCLKVDLDTGVLEEMAEMIEGRFEFGICYVNHRIYVVGGYDERSCEAYDILSRKWTRLPATCTFPDTYTGCITVESVQNRFIYGFGGYNDEQETQDSGIERIARLDTF